MKNLLFVLALGVLFGVLAGCKDSQQPPTPQVQVKPQQGVTMKKIVVYDFWAQWCPPCRAFGPTFEAWKKKYGNENITFQKVNTDEDKALTEKFKISSLPTIIVTHDGTEVRRWVGAPKESEILEYLK